MLMQNFKSAADLGITEPQFDALRKTLVLLETGKLQFTPDGSDIIYKGGDNEFSGHFNMEWWHGVHPCGTVACIGGTAELIGKVQFDNYSCNTKLFDLFEPRNVGKWGEITIDQGARALRSYLTTGDAKWHEAVCAVASPHGEKA